MQGAGRAAVPPHCKRAATKQRARRTPGKSANGDRARYILFLALQLIFQLSAWAIPEEFSIDPQHTYATFEVNHLGISTQRGRFNETSGKVVLDPQGDNNNIEIKINARSIDTGNESMEKLLRGDDFFNTEKYPDILFNARKIIFNNEKPEIIEGELTLLGVTKPVTLNVLSYNCTRKPFLIRLTCGIDAAAIIKRSEFGMNNLLSFVSDEVKLLIQVEAFKRQPAVTE